MGTTEVTPLATVTPQLTLTATLQDQTGAPIPKAQLIITLCGYGQNFPRIIGTSLIAKVGPQEYTLTNGSTAAWTTPEGSSGGPGIPIWGNDVIDPAGTFYSVAVVDQKKNIVQCGVYEFSGSGTIDLSNAAQIIPGPGGGTTPPLQFLTMDLFAISSTVAAQQAMALDPIADAMGWSVNRPIPLMAPRAQSFIAPPGYLYTISRSCYNGALVALFYNGLYQLPSIHYQLVNRNIGLQFYTHDGDNLMALYVATTLS